jgi:signal transduction histidine kinase
LVPFERLPLVRAVHGESVDGVEIFVKNSRIEGAWFEVSGRPLAIPHFFEGGLAVFRDVTAEKRARQALTAAHFELQQSEEKWRTLTTNLPGAIYRSDPLMPRRMRFMTAPVTAITGHVAVDFETLIFPEDCEAVYAALFRAFQENRPYAMEYRIRRADGAVRWIDDRGQPVCGEDGEVLWLDGILFDVTERKEAEEAFLKSVADLAHSNAEREQLELFAFVASHDLRAPLQKIMAFADLLDTPAGEAKKTDYLDRIRHTVMRMGTLMDDILKFTRAATAGQALAPLELDAVIADVLSDLEVRLEVATARVDVDPLPRLLGDRAQIGQLFQNLIGNAVKYARKDVPPVVKISASVEDGFALVRVEDNGIGFDEKHLDKIFKPFQRLVSVSDYEGSGIGLAICHKIAARHGGILSASSVPGKGSVFTARLPLAL